MLPVFESNNHFNDSKDILERFYLRLGLEHFQIVINGINWLILCDKNPFMQRPRMNIRNHLIEIQCNHRDVNDVAQALVHSIIFFRTHGKFNYKHEGSYSIGTLGFERAFCDHSDFTYVRCSSLAFVTRINNKIQEFADRINDSTHSGTVTLEFFQKRPNRWPFNDSKIVWEQWNIKITLVPSSSGQQALYISPSSPPPYSSVPNADHHGINLQRKHEHSYQQPRLEDLLSQKLLDIIKIVNNEKCSVPQMPTQPNLETVFDTSLSDLQPYLYNISYKISETAPGSHSVIGGTIGANYVGAVGGSASGTKSIESGSLIDGTTQSSLKKFLLGTLEL